jgi:hypothetical protein
MQCCGGNSELISGRGYVGMELDVVKLIHM